MGIEVKPVAGEYVIYNGNQFVMKFKRKENANYVAKMLRNVKSKDVYGYVFYKSE
jgi:hypothetical protein